MLIQIWHKNWQPCNPHAGLIAHINMTNRFTSARFTRAPINPFASRAKGTAFDPSLYVLIHWRNYVIQVSKNNLFILVTLNACYLVLLLYIYVFYLNYIEKLILEKKLGFGFAIQQLISKIVQHKGKEVLRGSFLFILGFNICYCTWQKEDSYCKISL